MQCFGRLAALIELAVQENLSGQPQIAVFTGGDNRHSTPVAVAVQEGEVALQFDSYNFV